MTITLGPGLRLPLDAVTQTFAILAMRGAGKTHTASVFAEELAEAVGITQTGGTFSTCLSRLRANGLVVVDGDRLVASEVLR